MKLPQIVPTNGIEKFLNTVMVETRFFVWDYWMLVHFLSGVLIGAFTKWSWWKVLLLFVGYEVFEFLLQGVLFRVESFWNVAWDIVFGMLGLVLIRYSLGIPLWGVKK